MVRSLEIRFVNGGYEVILYYVWTRDLAHVLFSISARQLDFPLPLSVRETDETLLCKPSDYNYPIRLNAPNQIHCLEYRNANNESTKSHALKGGDAQHLSVEPCRKVDITALVVTRNL